MIIWIMGLSGSGKTTLADIIKKKIKKKIIHIDGDAIRKIYSDKLGYTLKSREINAERISKLVKFLAEQNFDIIVSVLSNYPKWLNWNKKNLKDYYLVYLKTDMKILIKRKKKLYSQKKNIVGKDIKFNEPLNPNYVIQNCDSLNKLKKETNNILKEIEYFG